jgi:hypothetical protein
MTEMEKKNEVQETALYKNLHAEIDKSWKALGNVVKDQSMNNN